MFDYRRYAKLNYGCTAKRGKAAEFTDIAEELYFADVRIKYLALYDPSNEMDDAVAKKANILDKLLAVSRRIAVAC